MTETVRYPMPVASPVDPPPKLAELRRQEPVSKITLWNGKQAWLVTRFADARRVLQNPAIDADATDPNFPSMNPSQVVPNSRGGPARTGEPRHSELRKMVANKFTIRAVDEWRPVAEKIVGAQIASFFDGRTPPADLVPGFATPIPLRMVCYILGVPEDEMPHIERCSQQVISRPEEPGRPALAEFRTYVDDLISRKERDPGNDLIGQLVREQLRPGHIKHSELADLMLILLVAGHSTTASMIALGTLSLMSEPPGLQALRDDPSLIEPAVEEFLRFHTIVTDGAPRVAKRDVSIAGTTIRAGEAVVVSLAAANRDEQAFDRPDTLDIRRDIRESRRQLGFGFGGHRCLGQHLARMELTVTFTALSRAVPSLRLAVAFDEIRFRKDKFQHGVEELPVTWTAS